MGEAKLRDKGVYTLPKWTPFVEVKGVPHTEMQMQAMAQISGKPIEEIRQAMEDLKNDTLFMNSRYQVAISLEADGMVFHLSIKRLDRRPPGIERFRDFQRIKTELCGPERVGVEVYPAESELVDGSNQYHIYVFVDPTFRFPFGFTGGRHVIESQTRNLQPDRTRQLPHEDELNE